MDITGLLIYVLVQGITPGPSNFMSFYMSATYGLKGARFFLTGTVTGFFVKILLCGLLNLVLAAYVPSAMPVLKWVGAAYLLYLAVHVLLGGYQEKRAAEKKAADAAKAADTAEMNAAVDSNADAAAKGETEAQEELAPPQKGITATFWGGILLQVLNIKSWVMCLSLYSIYVIPHTQAAGTMLICAIGTTFVMIACTAVWALGGAAIKRVYAKYRMAFDIAMAILLLYCAVTAVL